MNFPSLTGQYGKEVQKAAVTFLEHKLIHFAGTDAHSNRRRSPKVKQAVDMLCDLVGEEELTEMTLTRPQKIIDNATFEIESPMEIKRKRWFEFWK